MAPVWSRNFRHLANSSADGHQSADDPQQQADNGGNSLSYCCFETPIPSHKHFFIILGQTVNVIFSSIVVFVPLSKYKKQFIIFFISKAHQQKENVLHFLFLKHTNTKKHFF